MSTPPLMPEPTAPVTEVMGELLKTLTRVAASDASILIVGESGTGKERLAALVHQRSPRRAGPFVVCDCSALPPTLIESELFGHTRGAFTGAGVERAGLFREADRGTMMLDSVDDIDVALQGKLLRVLQDRQVRPVGSDNPVHVDVRVVATTHRDLNALVSQGQFRRDLFYRLAVVPVQVPPLRERLADLPALAREILAAARPEQPPTLSKEALAALAEYGWPGNIRELENILTRLALLSPGDAILPADIRDLIAGVGSPPEAASVAVQLEHGKSLRQIVDATRRQVEAEAITLALKRAQGRMVTAAKLLKISRASLYTKLADYGLQRFRAD